MKTLTEVVLLLGLLILAYLSWVSQQQLLVLEQDMADVNFKIRELTAAPAPAPAKAKAKRKPAAGTAES